MAIWLYRRLQVVKTYFTFLKDLITAKLLLFLNSLRYFSKCKIREYTIINLWNDKENANLCENIGATTKIMIVNRIFYFLLLTLYCFCEYYVLKIISLWVNSFRGKSVLSQSGKMIICHGKSEWFNDYT